jgi:hypothetical protein
MDIVRKVSNCNVCVYTAWFCITRTDAMTALTRLRRQVARTILRGCLQQHHKEQRPSSQIVLSRLFPYYCSDIDCRASENHLLAFMQFLYLFLI